MTMPTNSKTWVFDVNNEVNNGNSTADSKEVLLAFKNWLCSVDVGCTVVRSCNSVSVSNGDEWVDVGDLVYTPNLGGTGIRSWAVIRLPAVFGATLELLLELRAYDDTDTYMCNVSVSLTPEGYNLATGTTTAPPSTTTGTAIAIEPYPGAGDEANFIARTATKKIWNGAVSSDKESIRFWVMCGGKCCTFAEISKLKNPVADLTSDDDWAVIWRGNKAAAAADSPTYTNMYTNADNYAKGYIKGTGAIVFGLSGECRLAGTTPTTNSFTSVPNPQDGDAYPMLPMAVWSSTNVAYAYGRHGEINDLWWGPSNLITGSTFPGDGSKTHIQLGNAFVVPWDVGVVPVIT
jgi:hypothetical protein